MFDEIMKELIERGPKVLINAFDGISTHSLSNPVVIVSSVVTKANDRDVEIANILIFSISLN
ncbi:MAG: hypothetical protein ACLFVQ_12710 [Chitinispirillaceae bacterium]